MIFPIVLMAIKGGWYSPNSTSSFSRTCPGKKTTFKRCFSATAAETFSFQTWNHWQPQEASGGDVIHWIGK